MNGVLWLANGGALAWEAHLGGYLTGALLAVFVFKA
jgi:membrane associated rhomboid family serine protease